MKNFNMLEFGNKTFFIDIDALEKYVTMNPDPTDVETTIFESYDSSGNLVSRNMTTISPSKDKTINLPKYETIRYFIDVLTEVFSVEMDETLGADRALDGLSFSHKLVINTLLKNGIIKYK